MILKLKNGVTYQIDRVIKNILHVSSEQNLSGKIESEYFENWDFLLEKKNHDLFKLHKDFSDENISTVILTKDNGETQTINFQKQISITQNITNTINETHVQLIRY